MKQTIDARGLTCPAPVLLVKDTVDNSAGEDLVVFVDNPASLENVSRFLKNKGYRISEAKEKDDFRIDAVSGEKIAEKMSEKTGGPAEQPAALKVLILVTSDCLGSGDDVLGAKLMVNYLKTLKEMGSELWQIIFVNCGVKLTTTASPVLEDLQEYERTGVIILACGTCLEHFSLTAEKSVGGTTNMLDIITATQLADKVVTVG